MRRRLSVSNVARVLLVLSTMTLYEAACSSAFAPRNRSPKHHPKSVVISTKTSNCRNRLKKSIRNSGGNVVVSLSENLHGTVITNDPKKAKQRRSGFRSLSGILSTLRAGGRSEDEAKSEKSTFVLASTTFNIMKAMLGSGCLALSSGLAAVTDHKNMIGPANLLFVFLGILSAYTFALYGRLSHATNAKSLGDIWKTVYKSESSTPISLANFCFCYGCCLIFLLIIGDTITSLLKAAVSTLSLTNLPGWILSRQTAILTVVTTLLLPLCNLKSMASLAPVSIVGVLASMVSSAFVVGRCPAVAASSPYQTPSGPFLKDLPTRYWPRFDSYSRVRSPAPLILVGMGGMALMAHFSAPDFYQSLVDTSDAPPTQKPGSPDKGGRIPSLPVRRYMMATLFSFVTVGIVNAMTMSCGFLTFGGNSLGMILNNYATRDVGAAVSRMLIAVSMIGGFPLTFIALRSAAEDLLEKPKKTQQQPDSGFKLKMVLLLSLTALSLVVPDAGFVVGLNGAVMGSAILYTFPALLFLKYFQNNPSSTTGTIRRGPGEQWLCRVLVIFGILSSLAGGTTTVLNTYFPHLLQ